MVYLKIKKNMDSSSPKNIKLAHQSKVSRKRLKNVETLIKWAGDDPRRRIKETPKELILYMKVFRL